MSVVHAALDAQGFGGAGEAGLHHCLQYSSGTESMARIGVKGQCLSSENDFR
jgi:hypothetical protein